MKLPILLYVYSVKHRKSIHKLYFNIIYTYVPVVCNYYMQGGVRGGRKAPRSDGPFFQAHGPGVQPHFHLSTKPFRQESKEFQPVRAGYILTELSLI